MRTPHRINFFTIPKQRKPISEAIFAAYLKGGRIWPQTRWSSNILVLDELSKLENSHNSFSQKNLKNLFNSTLSQQQLHNLRIVMDQDHSKGGIATAAITDELLKSQWLKTQIGIARMLQAFQENRAVEYYNESDYNKILKELGIITANLDFNFSAEENLFLKSTVNTAKNIISESKDLSRMFILSYHSEHLRRNYVLQNQKNYYQFLEKYNGSYSLENEPDEMRDWIETTIFNKIQTELKSKLTKDCLWIIYERDWAKRIQPMSNFALPQIPPNEALNKMYAHLVSPQQSSQKIIVTPYHWPDLDGIASAYSLSKLLQIKGLNSEAMIWEKAQLEAQWVMKKFAVTIPQISLKNDEKFILVDVSDSKDIPGFIPLKNVSAVIDHRKYFNLKDFPNAHAWISPVGSAATLIALLYVKANIIPDALSAKLLYLAIMSNTIKCKTHNTSAEDKIMANWLKNIGNVADDIVDEMFLAKSSFKNIKQQLDDDLSTTLQIINGKSTAIPQLEIVDAEEFLKKNQNEIITALQSLKQDRHAESLFLIAIDIKNPKTYFCFLDSEDKESISPKIPMQSRGYFFVTDDLLTRKEVIAMFQENENKETNSI